MKHTKRVIFFTIILIGGTSAFGFWALYSFNKAFSEMSELSNKNLTYSSKSLQTVTTPATQSTSTELVSSSTQISIDSKQKINSKDTAFNFVFPGKSSTLYNDCIYKITWVSPNINSANISLIDAGARKAVPKTTGIPKNIMGENLTSTEWKVSNIWPGKYYILFSNINNVNWEEKSPTFEIKDTDGVRKK